MKKLLFVLSILVLASCGQHKKEIARMQAKEDSLIQLNTQKENSITEFIGAMNDIQANLDSIKTIEKIVAVDKAQGNEMKPAAKQRIIESIAQINELLQQNKELVKKLQSRLHASNVKIAELEKMIDNLNKQISEKDTEIAGLKKDLENLHINVLNLNQKIETMTAENQKVVSEKNQTIEERTNELNTAFYAFGTKKELYEKKVIDKEGGFIGIGRTLALKKSFNRDYFQKVDIRTFNELPLNARKARVITNHPTDSYHFTGTKTVEALVIDKPEEFWKASKYLVVVVE
jgi:uncharacterized coiled-coil protein SlyX